MRKEYYEDENVIITNEGMEFKRSTTDNVVLKFEDIVKGSVIAGYNKGATAYAIILVAFGTLVFTIPTGGFIGSVMGVGIYIYALYTFLKPKPQAIFFHDTEKSSLANKNDCAIEKEEGIKLFLKAWKELEKDKKNGVV